MILEDILSFFWALLISVFAIPSITYVAHLKKLLDEPNLRTIHENLTPRLGGLAIFAGFLSAVTIFGEITDIIQKLIAGSILLFFIGLKDDIVSISAFKKFFVQLLATGIVVFMGDVKITNFYGILGIYELEASFSYGFTFLVIIGVTNAINLVDGLDGLAGTLILIITLTFGFLFLIFGDQNYIPFSLIAFALSGSALGFLRFNFKNATIFMGDTGSLVCGFIISVLAISFVEMQAVESSPALAIGILFIPIADTLRVFTIRLLKGSSPFSADKNHLHHKLIESGLSQVAVVLVLGGLNLFVIGFLIAFRSYGNLFALLFMIIMAVLLNVILLFKSTTPALSEKIGKS